MKHFTVNSMFSSNHLLFVILLGIFSTSILSCEKEINTPVTDRYIFLVHRNGDTLVESIIIDDFNNGKGLMKTPEIIGKGFTREFNLVIDKVNPNKWNFNARGVEHIGGTVPEGSGFFTSDTIYVELKWELGGVKNVDIFSGVR